MTDYEFGDVILVPFPFTDQTTSKKRPAAVVSSTTYNKMRPDLVFMAITSQTKLIAGFGELTIKQWNQAGLLDLQL
jgi:mRNA interferase MazF